MDAGDPAVVQVTINGTAVASYKVQQNALYVMLSAKLATRLGLQTKTAPRLIQRTPDGFFPSRLVQVKQLAAGGASAGEVPALVTARLPRGVECVLGQSFLTRFHVQRQGSGPLLLVPFSEAAQK